MELVVIIYGIAWLLSLLFLVYVFFTEKEKIFRRDNWHVWLLVIAFTPIILLGIILYISISCIRDKKKDRDLKKAKEYYQLALQDGYLEAQKELDKLEVEK